MTNKQLHEHCVAHCVEINESMESYAHTYTQSVILVQIFEFEIFDAQNAYFAIFN